MALYKPIDTSPRCLAVEPERHTTRHLRTRLNYLIDHKINLSGFDTRYGEEACPRRGIPGLQS